MVLKKKSTLLIMTFLIGLFVYAYGKENSITGESHLKNIEEVYSHGGNQKCRGRGGGTVGKGLRTSGGRT